MTARRTTSWLLLAAALLGFWAFVAPHQIGGRTAYVKVEGTSMEPGMHTGDLVVLRAQDRYGVGDVVAYRSDMAGAVVLHRIVGQNGERFVLQGDNNDFLDRYQPTHDDIVGRQVLHVPGGSTVASFFSSRTYLVLATLAAVLLVVVAATSAGRRDARRRRRRSEEVLT